MKNYIKMQNIIYLKKITLIKIQRKYEFARNNTFRQDKAGFEILKFIKF